MPTYNRHNLKGEKKGSERKTVRNSEKAWVYKAYPNDVNFLHPYLDFVRYMRWYCHRSYLQRRIYMREGYDPLYFYPKYPRFVA